MRSIVSRAGSACICLIVAGVLRSVATSSAVFAEEPSAHAAEPLVLELSIDSKLQQEILVREQSDFHVITQVQGVRWLVQGRIGRIVDGIVQVDLTFGVYGSPESSSTATTRATLPVDEFTGWGVGAIHGPMVHDVWLRRGFDPVPVLARSVVRRGKYFENAVCHLGELGPQAKPAKPELIAVLNDDAVDRTLKPHESVRRRAAESLGKIGPDASAAIDHLVQAERDENPYLRLASALALWRIAGDETGVPVAVEAINDHDHFVRSHAATTLGEMGAESDDTLRALVAALSDEDHHVRTDAALALWHIRRDPLALNCLRDLSQNCAEEKIRRYAARLLYNMEKEQAADGRRHSETD